MSAIKTKSSTPPNAGFVLVYFIYFRRGIFMSAKYPHTAVLYLDFDGTLTCTTGNDVFKKNLKLITKLSNSKTPEDRKELKEQYDEIDDSFKITNKAKDFLNQMSGLYPQVKIVIISRNFQHYIRGSLEFEGIDTTNITIHSRNEQGRGTGKGERKQLTVESEEILFNPGYRLICDDSSSDCKKMCTGAVTKSQNKIHSYCEKPGDFAWEAYAEDVKKHVENTKQNKVNDSAAKESNHADAGHIFKMFSTNGVVDANPQLTEDSASFEIGSINIL